MTRTAHIQKNPSLYLSPERGETFSCCTEQNYKGLIALPSQGRAKPLPQAEVGRGFFENNITGISNSANAVNGLGGNYSYGYEYDDMYRLTYSIGSFTDNNQTVFPCTLNMSYSLSGNITGKTVDATTLQAGAGQVHVDYEANYNYNSGQPHAIESISGLNATHDFQWDANGNMTLHNDQTAGFNRMLCWDEENLKNIEQGTSINEL